MRKTASYTRDELAKAHPEVVEAMDELIASDPRKFRAVNIMYCGRYTYPNGHKRRIQLGQAVEILQDNGYIVNIKIKKQ